MKSRKEMPPSAWMRSMMASFSAAFSVTGSNSVTSRIVAGEQEGTGRKEGLGGVVVCGTDASLAHWLVDGGLAVLASACANSAYAPEATGGASTLAPTHALNFAGKGITVFAASSLTEAFTEIGQKFESETGGGVTFNFGGSSDLRAQLEQGATADVFASADTNQMGLAKASGVVSGDGTVFAHNRLVVIIPKANSAGITTLQDLAKPA